MSQRDSGRTSGLAHAMGAHVIWGSMPLYLMLVSEVPVLEYVAWRTVFTLPMCLLVVAIWKTGSELRRVLGDWRIMVTLLGSAMMIGVNWFVYVWAIQNGNVYAASLGYYILPLTMMLLGLVFLGEKLSNRQWAAVALAAIGVGTLAAGALTTLWLSLSLAVSFGIYGLLRKTVAAGPLVGLTVESLLLTPIALAVLAWYFAGEQGSVIGRNALETAAIVAGGPLTALPLILFTTAARRMPYTVIGFLQFTAPTIVFLMGLLVFEQQLKPAQLACFILIWMAAALFTLELLRGKRPDAGDEAVSRGAAAS